MYPHELSTVFLVIIITIYFGVSLFFLLDRGQMQRKEVFDCLDKYTLNECRIKYDAIK